MNVLYTADQGSAAFEANRAAVHVVCCGDSLTGWNNFGPARTWPYRTIRRQCSYSFAAES
jgi:hypothetical protein